MDNILLSDVLDATGMLLRQNIWCGTNFLPAIKKVSQVVEDIQLRSDMRIAVIFLSDGEDGRENTRHILPLIRGMKIPFHTIAFGQAKQTELREMANASAGGTYSESTDREQLLQNFLDIQARLK